MSALPAKRSKTMCTDRRDFLRLSAGIAGATLLGSKAPFADTGDVDTIQQRQDVPDLIHRLKRMTAGVVPITAEERQARIAKAQHLMGEQKIDAVYIEPGASMFYFTGMRWSTSERMFALIIPQRGEVAWVCPKCEEERARELIRFSNDVRTWEEDESPYLRVAQIIRDRGIRTGRVGIEERVRFFLYDGIRQEAPKIEFVSATLITAGCRIFKSPAEIALLQKSNDLLLIAYRATWETMRDGMPQEEFVGNCATALHNLGVDGGIFCSFGKYTAFPHGSRTPQKLQAGDVVLMDGGCDVEGYQSDITRTFVFGKPTQRQRDTWTLEANSQAARFTAPKVATPHNS